MIQLTGIENIEQFIHDLEQATFVELDQAISQEFTNWTKKVMRTLVEGTPQFTGDLASAWNYSVESPDYSYTPIPQKLANATWNQFNGFVPYKRGDEPAVSRAMAKTDSVHPTWRQTVYLTNPAEIANWVERQMIMLRPVNLIDGRVAMIQYCVEKFNRGELGP